MVSIIFGLLGSFVMIMDNFTFGHWIVNIVSGFGKTEKGWKKLCNIPENKNSVALKESEKGFTEILNIILNNQPECLRQHIVAIENHTMSADASGMGEVKRNVIMLAIENQKEPNAIVSEETFKEWISRTRLKWVLSRGFTLIFMSFLFSLLYLLEAKGAFR